MKIFKNLLIAFGAFFGTLIVVGTYVFGCVKLAIWAFFHWPIWYQSAWICNSNNITKHTIYCHPTFWSSKLHYGMILMIVIMIIFTIIIGSIFNFVIEES